MRHVSLTGRGRAAIEAGRRHRAALEAELAEQARAAARRGRAAAARRGRRRARREPPPCGAGACGHPDSPGHTEVPLPAGWGAIGCGSTPQEPWGGSLETAPHMRRGRHGRRARTRGAGRRRRLDGRIASAGDPFFPPRQRRLRRRPLRARRSTTPGRGNRSTAGARSARPPRRSSTASTSTCAASTISRLDGQRHARDVHARRPGARRSRRAPNSHAGQRVHRRASTTRARRRS